MKKKMTLSRMLFMLTILLAVSGLVFFFMSYTTGYYIYGEADSILCTAVLSLAVLLETAAVVLNFLERQGFLTSIFSLAVSAALAAGMTVFIGNRVEGIGYTIITSFDAGHGGEEACMLSFLASGFFMAALLCNVTANFLPQKKTRAKSVVRD